MNFKAIELGLQGMIERSIAFMICLLGVLLPWRLRVVFSEILGWMVQQIYYSYYGILNFILKELKKAEDERRKKTQREGDAARSEQTDTLKRESHGNRAK
jgi:hypothetical protein